MNDASQWTHKEALSSSKDKRGKMANFNLNVQDINCMATQTNYNLKLKKGGKPAEKFNTDTEPAVSMYDGPLTGSTA